MFPKNKRLTRKEFSHFFSSGVKYHTTAFLMIHSNETKSTERYKIAASVSKKVYKTAVKRNLLRRRMYNAVCDYLMSQKISGIFIFFAKPPASEYTYSDIQQDIAKLIGRITKTG